MILCSVFGLLIISEEGNFKDFEDFIRIDRNVSNKDSYCDRSRAWLDNGKNNGKVSAGTPNKFKPSQFERKNERFEN